jgi:hypothetical protein
VNAVERKQSVSARAINLRPPGLPYLLLRSLSTSETAAVSSTCQTVDVSRTSQKTTHF